MMTLMDDRATHLDHDPKVPKPATLRDSARGQRLQRVMADAGVASRRVCEQLIEAGRVKVNGQIVTTLPAWVDPSRDRVLVDGQPLERPEPHVYIMLNKPARTLATPPEGPDDNRKSALAMVEHPLSARLFAAGRLDFEATGLLLLTNDGTLANRITHARYGVDKTYQMVVRGTMDDASLERVNRAIAQVTLRAAKQAGIPRAARADLTIVARENGRTVLELTVRDGRAVLVRDTLAALGHPVKSMERVAIGPLRLRAVAVGHWRELERDELSDLRRVASGKPPRAGSDAPQRTPGARARRPSKRAARPVIAKRFRGIGARIDSQPANGARPMKPARRNPRSLGPAAAGDRPAPPRAPRNSPDSPPPADLNDRRRGRGPGVNKNRSKPVPALPATRAKPGSTDRADAPIPDRNARTTRQDRRDRPARPAPADRPARAPRPKPNDRAAPGDRVPTPQRSSRSSGPTRNPPSRPSARPGARSKGRPR